MTDCPILNLWSMARSKVNAMVLPLVPEVRKSVPHKLRFCLRLHNRKDMTDVAHVRAAHVQCLLPNRIGPQSFQDANGDGIGDLPGTILRLDHLVDLGVDAVWIPPIYPSPMADFGYDVSDYCGIDPYHPAG